MISRLVEVGPLTLLVTLPIVVAGILLLSRMRNRSLTLAMATLALVPLAAALVGVLATNGFMYSSQLAGTSAVVLLVAVITMPAAVLLGRSFARDALWQSQARAAERLAENSRGELVSGMSHDLRSPLAGIRAMTDALAEGVVSDPAEIADYLGRIRRETDRTTAIVENLFQLSRASSPTLQLDVAPLALAEVVSDAVAAESAAAACARVTLVAPDPDAWPTVRADDGELTRVVRNLLHNAVRHTPPGGRVQLAAGSRQDDAWLQVRDECGGIPDGDIDRVFDVGFRGSAARTPHAGSGAGLGLAIARALIEAHGGRIGIANVDGGCCVTFSLPLAAPALRREAAS
jgi:signal transduction histidine kinase